MLPDTELTRVSATVSRTVALVQRLDEGRVLWPCVSHTIRSENTAECSQTGEGSEMETDRLNSPNTSTIAIEVLGHQLQFSQEKNSRKGRFCQSKLRGKRVIELGAGCGVAGFGMAMLGCDVVSTDQKEVLPLLRRNLERNTSGIMQMNPGSDSFGSVKVVELDWGNKDHILAVDPPYDYIIGTDVVYAEHLLEPLLETIFALSGPRTTILLGYEIRSTSVHEKMIQMWKRSFDVKLIPKSKMDSTYQHPSIQLFMMGLKAPAGSTRETNQGLDQLVEANKNKNQPTKRENEGSVESDDSGRDKGIEDGAWLAGLPNGELNSWEVRRYGVMAARLLRDVKIT